MGARHPSHSAPKHDIAWAEDRSVTLGTPCSPTAPPSGKNPLKKIWTRLSCWTKPGAVGPLNTLKGQSESPLGPNNGQTLVLDSAVVFEDETQDSNTDDGERSQSFSAEFAEGLSAGSRTPPLRESPSPPSDTLPLSGPEQLQDHPSRDLAQHLAPSTYVVACVVGAQRSDGSEVAFKVPNDAPIPQPFLRRWSSDLVTPRAQESPGLEDPELNNIWGVLQDSGVLPSKVHRPPNGRENCPILAWPTIPPHHPASVNGDQSSPRSPLSIASHTGSEPSIWKRVATRVATRVRVPTKKKKQPLKPKLFIPASFNLDDLKGMHNPTTPVGAATPVLSPFGALLNSNSGVDESPRWTLCSPKPPKHSDKPRVCVLPPITTPAASRAILGPAQPRPAVSVAPAMLNARVGGHAESPVSPVPMSASPSQRWDRTIARYLGPPSEIPVDSIQWDWDSEYDYGDDPGGEFGETCGVGLELENDEDDSVADSGAGIDARQQLSETHTGRLNY